MLRCTICLCLIMDLTQVLDGSFAGQANPTDMPMSSRDLLRKGAKMASYIQTLSAIKVLPSELQKAAENGSELLVENERVHVPQNKNGLEQVTKIQLDREKLQRYLDILDLESVTKAVTIQLDPSRVMGYVQLLSDLGRSTSRPEGLIYKSRIKSMKGASPILGINGLFKELLGRPGVDRVSRGANSTSAERKVNLQDKQNDDEELALQGSSEEDRKGIGVQKDVRKIIEEKSVAEDGEYDDVEYSVEGVQEENDEAMKRERSPDIDGDVPPMKRNSNELLNPAAEESNDNDFLNLAGINELGANTNAKHPESVMNAKLRRNVNRHAPESTGALIPAGELSPNSNSNISSQKEFVKIEEKVESPKSNEAGDLPSLNQINELNLAVQVDLNRQPPEKSLTDPKHTDGLSQSNSKYFIKVENGATEIEGRLANLSANAMGSVGSIALKGNQIIKDYQNFPNTAKMPAVPLAGNNEPITPTGPFLDSNEPNVPAVPLVQNEEHNISDVPLSVNSKDPPNPSAPFSGKEPQIRTLVPLKENKKPNVALENKKANMPPVLPIGIQELNIPAAQQVINKESSMPQQVKNNERNRLEVNKEVDNKEPSIAAVQQTGNTEPNIPAVQQVGNEEANMPAAPLSENKELNLPDVTLHTNKEPIIPEIQQAGNNVPNNPSVTLVENKKTNIPSLPLMGYEESNSPDAQHKEPNVAQVQRFENKESNALRLDQISNKGPNLATVPRIDPQGLKGALSDKNARKTFIPPQQVKFVAIGNTSDQNPLMGQTNQIKGEVNVQMNQPPIEKSSKLALTMVTEGPGALLQPQANIEASALNNSDMLAGVEQSNKTPNNADLRSQLSYPGLQRTLIEAPKIDTPKAEGESMITKHENKIQNSPNEFTAGSNILNKKSDGSAANNSNWNDVPLNEKNRDENGKRTISLSDNTQPKEPKLDKKINIKRNEDTNDLRLTNKQEAKTVENKDRKEGSENGNPSVNSAFPILNQHKSRLGLIEGRGASRSANSADGSMQEAEYPVNQQDSINNTNMEYVGQNTIQQKKVSSETEESNNVTISKLNPAVENSDQNSNPSYQPYSVHEDIGRQIGAGKLPIAGNTEHLVTIKSEIGNMNDNPTEMLNRQNYPKSYSNPQVQGSLEGNNANSATIRTEVNQGTILPQSNDASNTLPKGQESRTLAMEANNRTGNEQLSVLSTNEYILNNPLNNPNTFLNEMNIKPVQKNGVLSNSSQPANSPEDLADGFDIFGLPRTFQMISSIIPKIQVIPTLSNPMSAMDLFARTLDNLTNISSAFPMLTRNHPAGGSSDRQAFISRLIRKGMGAEDGEPLLSSRPVHEAFPLHPIDEINDIQAINDLAHVAPKANRSSNQHRNPFYRPTKPPFMFDQYYSQMIDKLKSIQRDESLKDISNQKEILTMLNKNLEHLHMDRGALSKIIGKALTSDNEEKEQKLFPKKVEEKYNQVSQQRGNIEETPRTDPHNYILAEPVYPRAMDRWKEKTHLNKNKRSPKMFKHETAFNNRENYRQA